VDLELSVDVSQVELNRLRGNEEGCGHRAVRFALGDELSDLELLGPSDVPERPVDDGAASRQML
jgi:hypothetical protein